MSNSSKQRAYSTVGNIYFRQGEAVFINSSTESAAPHPHTHDFIEIAYVAKGEGMHHIGNNCYPVSKGDLFVINFDIVHDFRSFDDPAKTPITVYNCLFKPEFLDYNLINCKDFSDIAHHFLFRSLFPEEIEQQSDIHIIGKDSENIERLYEKMQWEYQAQTKGYIEILRAYVIELLVTIFRLYDHNDKFHDRLVYNRREIITNAMKYMKENYQKGVSLDELSAISFLSPNYFCKMFRETTQYTVSEYIQTLRIDRACELLRTTNDTILNIAYDVGYKDIKFFNKVFKKKTGSTPGDYRRSRTQKPTGGSPGQR